MHKGSTSGFRFLHHSTDLNEPDKPVTSVFLILQHRVSYTPRLSKIELSVHRPIFCVHKGSICTFFARIAIVSLN